LNHDKMIRTTINSYSDFPKVQSDMRKLLKYASSWQRMNLDRILTNEPIKVANPTLDALVASTEDFESTEDFTPAVKADALAVAKAITAQVILSQAGCYDTLKQELAVKYSAQPAVAEYLRKSALVILSWIEEFTPAELLQLRKQ